MSCSEDREQLNQSDLQKLMALNGIDQRVMRSGCYCKVSHLPKVTGKGP